MTNTRITDPEILEKRYAVILREFSIRKGSGGGGLHPGGDGVVRDIEFRIDLSVGILSDRRVHRPYGMAGGSPGESGQNLWITHDADGPRTVSIGGKNTVFARKGDRVIIKTPSGGGWGSPSNDVKSELLAEALQHQYRATGSVAAMHAIQQSN